MIIFDLDSLADCEHRRHFIQAPWDYCHNCYLMLKHARNHPEHGECGLCKRNPFIWELDYKAFNEACGEDKPIEPSIRILNLLLHRNEKIEIWSGRSEVVREKTERWLVQHTVFSSRYPFMVRMRAIGDTTSDHELFERWIREHYDSLYPHLDKDAIEGTTYRRKEKIEMVFSANPEVINMFRRYGIFVFDCNQHIQI